MKFLVELYSQASVAPGVSSLWSELQRGAVLVLQLTDLQREELPVETALSRYSLSRHYPGPVYTFVTV